MKYITWNSLWKLRKSRLQPLISFCTRTHCEDSATFLRIFCLNCKIYLSKAVLTYKWRCISLPLILLIASLWALMSGICLWSVYCRQHHWCGEDVRWILKLEGCAYMCCSVVQLFFRVKAAFTFSKNVTFQDLNSKELNNYEAMFDQVKQCSVHKKGQQIFQFRSYLESLLSYQHGRAWDLLLREGLRCASHIFRFELLYLWALQLFVLLKCEYSYWTPKIVNCGIIIWHTSPHWCTEQVSLVYTEKISVFL